MPTLNQLAGTPIQVLSSPTLPGVNVVSSSEAASLKGKPAKTPLLAGSIIGSIMGAAYVVGFTIYFVRRLRRKKRNALIRAGLAEPVKPKAKVEKVIMPPDPAVVLGLRQPGDNAFDHAQPSAYVPPESPDHGSGPSVPSHTETRQP